MYVIILIMHAYHKMHSAYSVLEFHKGYFCKVAYTVLFISKLFLYLSLLRCISSLLLHTAIQYEVVSSIYLPYIAFFFLHWWDKDMLQLTHFYRKWFHSKHLSTSYLKNLKVFLWDIYQNHCVIWHSSNSITPSCSYSVATTGSRRYRLYFL